MFVNPNTEEPHVTIYLTTIHKGPDNKRTDERIAIEELLQSGVIHSVPKDIRILHQENGSPHFSEDIGKGISISHSDHILAVAIYPDTYRVGIDVEERADQAAQLIRRVSNDSEMALMTIYNLPPIVLWSAKEAVYKAFSDRIMTMSGQVVLKRCQIDKRLLTLNVIQNDRTQFLTEVHYLSTLEDVEVDEVPFTDYPFVLAFASNIPDVRISIQTHL